MKHGLRGLRLCGRSVVTGKRLGHYRVDIFRLDSVAEHHPKFGVPGTLGSNPEPY